MDIRFQAALPEGIVRVARIVRPSDDALLTELLSTPHSQPGKIAGLIENGRHVLLVGTGTGDAAAFERAGAALVMYLRDASDAQLAIDLRTYEADGLTVDEVAAHFAFGAMLGGWTPPSYSIATGNERLCELVLVGAEDTHFAPLRHLAEGILLARDLVTEPPNKLDPVSFVARCQPLAALGVVLTALDETAMRELDMGALLGVAQGSAKPPRLLAMRWRGDETAPFVALVGKGITFDAGGISMKVAAGMEAMKTDMAGAAAVVGALRALAGARAPVNVIGVIALAENMPSGSAQRPSDVVHTMSGQSVEVVNTDCEGRLVLCDALTWVQRTHRPETVIDIATLTGGVVVALGNEHAGLFANDDALADALVEAGNTAGETVWRLPMGPAYDRLIDSPIADMKNFDTAQGGPIKAAQFLARFVEGDTRWAHIDMAGMAWRETDGPMGSKGATGYGVRLLTHLLQSREPSADQADAEFAREATVRAV